MPESLRSPAGRPLGRLGLSALLGSLILTLSCGREITGPAGALSVSAPIALLTQFQQLPGQASLSSGVEFAQLRATLLRLNGSVAVDRVVDFPSTSDSIALNLTATFGPGATADGEQMLLLLRFFTAAGDTVFQSGPDSVFLHPASRTANPTPVVVEPEYVGPGSQATRVELSQTDVTVSGSAGTVFTAQAFDAQNAPVPTAPILFTSSDTSLVRFANARNGSATTVARRDSAFVYATLLTGPTDSARVRVTLPAANLALITGNFQTGAIGTTLGAPVTVRVTASDAVAVQGVAVTFATTEGSVGASPVVTDANGDASTSWTLGSTVGTQTLTASVAGLTGSPITFTATAVSGAAVSLQFTANPVSAVAGLSLGTIVVTARDAQSNVATTFSDSVTIAIGANAGGGALSGTQTVSAVNGVATFTGLSINRTGTGYTLAVSAPGLTGSSSSTFNITSAAATSLAFFVQPASVAVNTVLSPPVQVEARDAFGNRATDFTNNVTVALALNPGTAALGGTLSQPAVAGVATFANLTVDVISAGYALEASAAGLTADTSGTFNTVAELNAWINTAGGLWNSGANWSLGRIPIATDSIVISVPGTYTVTLNQHFTGTHLTLGGATGTQTLTMNGRTLTLAGQLSVESSGVLSASGSLINGSGALSNSGTMLVRETSTAVSTTNDGLIVANGANGFSGAFATGATSVVRIQPDGSTGNASITFANGFSNYGLLELTATVSTYSSALVVSAGTLTNESTGIIRSTVGTGGLRTMSAQVNNLGLIDVNHPLAWNGVSAAQVNSGSITVDANLTLTQSGTAPSFSNLGGVIIAGPATFSVTGGAYSQVPTSIGGTGNLTFTNAALDLPTAFATQGLTTSMLNTTVGGAGSLTNTAGRTLAIRGTTINVPLVNEGLLSADGSNSLAGSVTAPVGSTIRMLPTGSTGFSNLSTVGFTNQGSIELTSSTSTYSSTLTIASGTLVNAASGSISTLPGTGGNRTFVGSVNNQGLISVQQPLQWDANNTLISNSGTLDVVGGNLVMTQTGSAQFSASGVVNIAAGRALNISGGAIAQNGGGYTGTGVLSFLNLTVGGTDVLTIPATRALAMRGVTVTIPLVNNGLLEVDGPNSIQGSYTAALGSVLRVLPTGSTGNSTLTVATGFNNFGLIELTSSVSTYTSALVVTAGSLTNEGSGIIRSAVGTGGPRTLTAQVNNLGVIDIDHPLAWNGVSAAQINNGSITVDANLTLTQSGTAPSFSNLGGITIAGPATFSVTGGAFSQTPASIGGTGTLAFTNAALDLPTAFATQGLTTSMLNTTVGGAGSLTNTAGRTLAIRGVTINVPLVNEGVLNTDGNNTLAVSVTAPPGSTLRTLPTGSTGNSSLTTVGFLNEGNIELTSSTSTYGSMITIASGTLVNGAGGSISSLPGTGGPRNLAGAVDNQGTIDIQHPLTWTAVNTSITSSGALNVSGGNLVVNQSVASSITVVGVVDISAGRSLSINGGNVQQAGGSFTGTGVLNLTDLTVTGPGTLVNPAGRTISLRNSTIAAPFTNAGSLAVVRPSVVTGALTTMGGSNILIASDGSVGSATLLVANGFTNEGSIELSSTASSYTAGLEVSGGPLVNAAGGSIISSAGTGGVRTLNAAVQNSGSITVNHPLTWVANSTNNDVGGVLDVQGGNLTVNQTGSALFTVAGTVTIGTGRAMTVNGGTLTQSTGNFTGAGPLFLTNATVSGPGAFTNPAGRTVELRNSTIAADFSNAGTLDVRSSSNINAALTTVLGSTIRIWSDGAVGSVTLTVANGFANDGTIVLTSAASSYTSQLALSAGTLTNAPSGIITTLPGTGGARSIIGQIVNNGSIAIQQPTVWTAANTANENNGLIDVSGGNLTINQTGSASFISDGLLQVGVGRILRLSGGTFEQTGGGFTGSGEFDLQDASVVGSFFDVPAGFAMRMRNATVTAPFTNQGFVWVATSSAINSNFIADSGSTLRIASDGSVGSTTLSMAIGFSNSGLVELSSSASAYTSVLNLGSATLTNNVDGVINIARATGGSRSIVGNVSNDGQLVMSADGATLLNITGSLLNSGSIEMGLGGINPGSQYDQIVVSANATLGGTLNVILMGAYVPVSPNSFALITTGGTLSGTFATANLASPLAATPSYSANAVTVAVP